MEKRLPIRLSAVAGLTGLAWASLYEIQLAVFNHYAPDAVALNTPGQTVAQLLHGYDQLDIFYNVLDASGWVLAAVAIILCWRGFGQARFLSVLAVELGMMFGGLEIFLHVWAHQIPPGQWASAVMDRLPVNLAQCGIRALMVYLAARAIVWPIDRMKVTLERDSLEDDLPENLTSSQRRKIKAARRLLLFVIADDPFAPWQLRALQRSLENGVRWNTNNATKNYVEEAISECLPGLVVGELNRKGVEARKSLSRRFGSHKG